MNNKRPCQLMRNLKECLPTLEPHITFRQREVGNDPRTRRQIKMRSVGQGDAALFTNRGIKYLIVGITQGEPSHYNEKEPNTCGRRKQSNAMLRTIQNGVQGRRPRFGSASIDAACARMPADSKDQRRTIASIVQQPLRRSTRSIAGPIRWHPVVARCQMPSVLAYSQGHPLSYLMDIHSFQSQLAINHCVRQVTSHHALGYTQAQGYVALRYPLKPVKIHHLLTLGRQLLQKPQQLVGLLRASSCAAGSFNPAPAVFNSSNSCGCSSERCRTRRCRRRSTARLAAV